MKRVLVCLTNSNDACSWYRGIGPWSEMHRRGLVDVWYSALPKWQDVRAVDAVFMLRPCTKEMKEGIQAAKDFGRPVIMDYDDDLLALPNDNPSYPLFAVPEIRTNLTEFMGAADAIIASTDFLKDQLQKRAPKARIEVIRNAYDPCLTRFRSDQPRNKSVVWRGTSTHHRDVASVADQIVQSAKRHPEFLFIFMGADPAPWACSERIKNVLRVNKLDLMYYFRALSGLRPRVVIAPLADSGFNRSKSNIAAIEAAYAGASCIAPAWEEWSFPGVINYQIESAFEESLERAMMDDEFNAASAKNAWASVENYFTLDAANQKRLELLESLVAA